MAGISTSNQLVLAGGVAASTAGCLALVANLDRWLTKHRAPMAVPARYRSESIFGNHGTTRRPTEGST